MRLQFLICMVLAAWMPSVIWGQESVPSVLFPQITVSPAPQVVPVKMEADPLKAGQLYVIQSDVEFMLLASPSNLVTITKESGPMKIRGVFADGSGRTETRTFQSKFIMLVDPVEGVSGRVELIAIPKGVDSEDSIVRRLLDVGAGPRPPPEPDPVDPDPVDPDPTPDPIPAPTGVRVLFIYESSANNSAEQLNILHSTKIAAYLNEKCVKENNFPEWRRWDKDVEIGVKESETMKNLWTAVKPKLGTPPQVVVVLNGNAEIYDLPATEDLTLQFLKDKIEGKK